MSLKICKIFILIILIYIFFFSACFEVEIETVLNSNGSGVRIFTFKTQYSDLYNEFKMQLKKDDNFAKWKKIGAEIEESIINGKHQLKYIIPFKNVIQLNEEDVTYSFLRSGIFKLEYVYIEKYKERKKKEYIGDMFSIQSSIKMPGKIVYSNPSGVRHNNTLIWNLDLNELQNGKVLIVKSTRTNWLIVIILSIIGVGVIGIFVYRLFLRNIGIKEKINYFFTRTKDKIRVTQFKLKLSNEQKKRETMIKHLGQKSWELKIKSEKAKIFTDKLYDFDKEIEKNQRDIERIDNEIKEYENRKRETLDFYSSEIKKQEELKSPEENKLKELNKERRICFKGIENIKKEMSKELEESKKKELKDKTIPLEKKLKKLEEEIKKGKSVIQTCTEQIRKLKFEKKEKMKESESRLSQLKKQRASQEAANCEIKQKKLPLFKELGNVINEERVKTDELNPIYSQIDKIDKNIRKIKRGIDILR